ncbi:MAG: efflux RND transporter periplasmic adaptor subunit [Candidatus Omnitrophota bacterium]
MKYTKLIRVVAVIIVSFTLGIIVSRTLIKREGRHAYSEKEEGHHEEEAGEIKLSQASQQAIGLETVVAKRSHFIEKIPVTGQIAQDAEEITHVVSSESGVIAERKAEIGRLVNKNDALCVIKINGADTLNEIKSPIAGTIIADFTKEGEKVDTISSLYTVVDLTKLLASFDVYEKDVSQIKLGQKLAIHSIAYPQETFEGEITFISPRVDEHTHTIKIRGRVKNGRNLLKLGMFITAEVIVESDEEFIVLPQDAVHHLSGKRIVFVKAGDNDFQAKEVVVTKESKESVAIVEGIKEGEVIVTKDGFLLKSELLKAKIGEGCAE